MLRRSILHGGHECEADEGALPPADRGRDVRSSYNLYIVSMLYVCYVCMYVCMYVCVCVYVCMYVCMYVCVYVCIYLCLYLCIHV